MKLYQLRINCKAILSLLFALFSFTASAQQNTSVWVYTYLDRWTVKGDSIYGSGSYYIYQSIGTIEFEGREYTMIRIQGAEMPTVKQRRVSGQYIPDNYLAIRYDNGRILTNRQDYMNYLANKYSDDYEYHRDKYRVSFGDASYVPYHQTDDGEIILYDFNMEVGDGYLHVEGYDDVYVTETGSVTLTDGKHKRLTLNNGLVLIEGIGCINSPGMLFDYLNPSPFIKTWICDLALYDIVDEDGGSASPIYEYTNPLIADRAVGIDDVRVPKDEASGTIYNLQGQRIGPSKSSFKGDWRGSKGLYIVDGKKLLIK